MKKVKSTRCYTMVYWTLWFPEHVLDIIMPIIRSLRLYIWPQRVALHLGYGRLLVWCMEVGFKRPDRGMLHIIMPIIRSLRLYRWPQRVTPHLGYGRLLVWYMAVGFKRPGKGMLHDRVVQMAPACGNSRWGHVYSRKLLMMDIIMSETCWANHKVQ
jgi:hypothetical protein